MKCPAKGTYRSRCFFSFEMTIESFLEGHVRAFEWLEGVPREWEPSTH